MFVCVDLESDLPVVEHSTVAVQDGFVDVCDLTADDDATGSAPGSISGLQWSRAPKVRTEVRLE